MQRLLAGARSAAALDNTGDRRRLRLDRGGDFLGHHTLRLGLAAGAAGGEPHQTQRNDLLGFESDQDSLAGENKPRIP